MKERHCAIPTYLGGVSDTIYERQTPLGWNVSEKVVTSRSELTLVGVAGAEYDARIFVKKVFQRLGHGYMCLKRRMCDNLFQTCFRPGRR